MRRLQGVLVFACLAGWLASGDRPAAHAQPAKGGPTYWANHKFDFPVNVDAVKQYHAKQKLPDPVEIQLFASRSGGPFVASRKLGINALDKTREGKSGFANVTVDKDGDYEFAVQFIYQDGGVSARPEDLRADNRLIIDTTPPAVQIRGTANRVDWSITDDNLDPSSVKLQCKLPSWTEWKTINDRAMKATDRYAWELRPNDSLEVRVSARDKAGNEGVSSLVRLPADGAGGSPRPAPGGNEWPPPGGGAGTVPQPRVLYVNTKDFEIDYTIQRMGRSGVKAAHLYVLKEQGLWSLAKTDQVDLTPNGKEQNLAIKYAADKQGTYGFYVIPESRANEKADPPRKDDPPQVLVVVDTEKPYVKITGINVRAGGVRGPIVEITWQAHDQTLMPNSINLEYSIDKAALTWKEIKYKTSNAPNSNTGRFEWEVQDPDLWKFHVRISATDWAKNTGEHVWDKEVLVDLEKPAAGINDVRGSGTPPKQPDKSPPATGGSGLPKGAGSGTPPTPPLPVPGGVGPPAPPRDGET